MPIAPTDIFDRTAGWGHSAGTQFNPSAGATVVVQAQWSDPSTQSVGDQYDIQAVPAPLSGFHAKDGEVAGATLPVTQPTVTRNSTVNGVTTSVTYSGISDHGHILDDRQWGWGHGVTTRVINGVSVTSNSSADTGSAPVTYADKIPATNQLAAFGGLFDRVSGYGHTVGGASHTVTMNGAPVTVPVAHD